MHELLGNSASLASMLVLLACGGGAAGGLTWLVRAVRARRWTHALDAVATLGLLGIGGAVFFHHQQARPMHHARGDDAWTRLRDIEPVSRAVLREDARAKRTRQRDDRRREDLLRREQEASERERLLNQLLSDTPRP